MSSLYEIRKQKLVVNGEIGNGRYLKFLSRLIAKEQAKNPQTRKNRFIPHEYSLNATVDDLSSAWHVEINNSYFKFPDVTEAKLAETAQTQSETDLDQYHYESVVALKHAFEHAYEKNAASLNGNIEVNSSLLSPAAQALISHLLLYSNKNGILDTGAQLTTRLAELAGLPTSLIFGNTLYSFDFQADGSVILTAQCPSISIIEDEMSEAVGRLDSYICKQRLFFDPVTNMVNEELIEFSIEGKDSSKVMKLLEEAIAEKQDVYEFKSGSKSEAKKSFPHFSTEPVYFLSNTLHIATIYKKYDSGIENKEIPTPQVVMLINSIKDQAISHVKINGQKIYLNEHFVNYQDEEEYLFHQQLDQERIGLKKKQIKNQIESFEPRIKELESKQIHIKNTIRKLEEIRQISNLPGFKFIFHEGMTEAASALPVSFAKSKKSNKLWESIALEEPIEARLAKIDNENKELSKLTPRELHILLVQLTKSTNDSYFTELRAESFASLLADTLKHHQASFVNFSIKSSRFADFLQKDQKVDTQNLKNMLIDPQAYILPNYLTKMTDEQLQTCLNYLPVRYKNRKITDLNSAEIEDFMLYLTAACIALYVLSSQELRDFCSTLGISHLSELDRLDPQKFNDFNAKLVRYQRLKELNTFLPTELVNNEALLSKFALQSSYRSGNKKTVGRFFAEKANLYRMQLDEIFLKREDYPLLNAFIEEQEAKIASIISSAPHALNFKTLHATYFSMEHFNNWIEERDKVLKQDLEIIEKTLMEEKNAQNKLIEDQIFEQAGINRSQQKQNVTVSLKQALKNTKPAINDEIIIDYLLRTSGGLRSEISTVIKSHLEQDARIKLLDWRVHWEFETLANGSINVKEIGEFYRVDNLFERTLAQTTDKPLLTVELVRNLSLINANSTANVSSDNNDDNYSFIVTAAADKNMKVEYVSLSYNTDFPYIRNALKSNANYYTFDKKWFGVHQVLENIINYLLEVLKTYINPLFVANSQDKAQTSSLSSIDKNSSVATKLVNIELCKMRQSVLFKEKASTSSAALLSSQIHNDSSGRNELQTDADATEIVANTRGRSSSF